MMEKKTRKDGVKRAFLFYALSAMTAAVMFACFMQSSSVKEVMDLEGWVFFAASCLSHASQIMLPSFLVSALLVWCRLSRTANIVQAVLTALTLILIDLDSQVYSIYRFHINGFVLSMVFGEGASQIFTFDTQLYVKETLRLLGVFGALTCLCAYVARIVYRRRGKAYALPVALSFVGCTLFAHLWHIYASFKQHQSVTKSAMLLPYYFPTTANGLMFDLGMVPPESYQNMADSRQSSDVSYPLNPLDTVTPQSLPNIVVIAVDSWNRRALTNECMPNVYKYATENQWFTNHLSSSNGTRSSIFGLFFGLSCYYWESFEPSHIQPLLIDRLLQLGYHCQAYPSATLLEPPFAKVVFGNVKGLNVSTPGDNTFDRDSKITEMVVADMKKRDKSKPFFSFVFYDLPHSFELSKEQNVPFKPAWDYADYTRLNNDLDPTPFWNLYRNCCYQDDKMIGRVLKAIDDEGLADNTIVVITGDHSQEFNENHRNYWGHNSNFSIHQTGVPLVCHFPGQLAARHNYRTTHYDVVPTLMHDYLGVRNPVGDYSMGKLLNDSTPRLWHIVGSNLNYAFIIGGDTILEKKAEGALEVYDARMKPVTDFRMPVKEFDQAVKELNRFFKK